ncbi:class III extradiol ring-cleavage dioxygenase [uncultured Veillonella sp.]|uniref:DODA-type extradiol aromatic ring-opening family dioxygenase n=1 Tax=uncultured Veillonella sp. TaxID=159268 RepID=UPI0025F7202D|nr:class III extradiol ring-cleavage dioxygenase [uncultured Veillonella sp.]
MSTKEKMPVVFIGHGSPMNLIEENPWTKTWEDMAQKIPTPKAILMISAHWYTDKTLLQSDEEPSMIYDMYGFPDPIYELEYGAPTSKALIHRVKDLLGDKVVLQDNRGYDHGAYAPLLKMYPEAQIPVVQLSVNYKLNARQWFALGQLLSPLREEGVLIIGSGDIVHNLRLINPSLGTTALPPAEAFEESLLRKLDPTKDNDLLGALHWEAIPGAKVAAEHPDHLAPLFYCLGAVLGPGSIEALALTPYALYTHDYVWGSLSMTSLSWGII